MQKSITEVQKSVRTVQKSVTTEESIKYDGGKWEWSANFFNQTNKRGR